ETEEAIASALHWATEQGGAVCIAGSLYLAGEILSRRTGGDLFREPEPKTGRAKRKAGIAKGAAR
ncbi:MAG: hypothetical protein U1E27_07740, partial [Kiritimatiellia bacterium]|nr:hypothetical protein [Kiritimatiellia bacterium]